jgi:hypothetical protein
VQAVDLWATLPALLLSHPSGEAQQKGEFGFEPGIAIDLAGCQSAFKFFGRLRSRHADLL